MSLDLSNIHTTGYDPYERFFATRFKQGGRTVYSLDWSVAELVAFLPKPDPDKPLDADSTQRRIVVPHATGFADYVINDSEWVSPALLLRAPDIFQFEAAKANTGSTQLGTLGVPKHAKADISIVDGQHRTLGFHIAWEKIATYIEKARADLARAKDEGDPLRIRNCEAALQKWVDRRDRLARERVSVQIMVIENPSAARRIFVDINDNAKGISGSVRGRFDDRKVLSRALNTVLHDSDLLDDRVDLESDRISANSEFLLGAKHVADILRALTVGSGRIGKRLEAELDDREIVKKFAEFETGLIDAFPQFEELMDGDLAANELRRSSLIGSNVMLRGFALAWHNLRQAGWTSEQITAAMKKMAPHMDAPVFPDPEDSWFATGLFPANEKGSLSPTSRAQDFRKLGDFIQEALEGKVAWKRTRS
ncbi:DNA sulfur modification protein DndB [Mesorhizobium sp. B2-6-6]|uniref:DNA sulfur modification protein DndB n=1 Tax=Mesorhizobium sp. B2-6-6 TaxID=2589911 RepID=UPI00112B6C6F|nr:hypothetical protein FJ437_32485 [Mesorhizobium sp. B2-6-6]